MRTTMIMCALAAAVVAGCGGDDAGDGDNSALRDQVQAYATAYLEGDANTSHELLSKRCQDIHDIDSWRNLVATATGMYGDALPDITTYEEDIDGDTAVVSYGFEVSELDQADERWLREDDAWHVDDC